MKGLDLNRDRKSQTNEKEKVQFKTLDNQQIHSIKSTQNQFLGSYDNKIEIQ
jgi:hypothetical protein